MFWGVLRFFRDAQTCRQEGSDKQCVRGVCVQDYVDDGCRGVIQRYGLLLSEYVPKTTAAARPAFFKANPEQ